MNMFAAKQSGVASMIESMIPKEIMDSIKQVTGQLPAILETVQQKVESIEQAQIRIENNQCLILNALEELRCKMDPDATPRIQQVSENLRKFLDGETLPVNNPSPTGTALSFAVDERTAENVGIGNGSD